MVRTKKKLGFNNLSFQLAIVFMLCYIFFGVLQFQTHNIVGTDGYYHIKFAYLTRTEGFITEFPWWETSIFNEGFADEYIIYHLLLVPFTFLNLILAAKLSSVFFATFFATVFYYVIKKLGVKHAYLWLILLLVSSSKLLYRLQFPRAIALSAALMLLLFLFLKKKKYMLQGFLCFAFVWTFPAFYFPLIILGAYIAALYFVERKLDSHAVLACVSGVALGFVINPYFPSTLMVAYTHSFHMILSLMTDQGLNVITENKVSSLSYMASHSLLVLILYVCALVSAFLSKKRWLLFSGLLATGFLLLGFLMVRAVDYFVPFIILFSALSFNHLIKRKSYKKFITIFLIILSIVAFLNVYKAAQEISQVRSSDRFSECAKYIKYDVPDGDIIFHTSWDNFPELFFYNHENYYLFGLAPDFLYVYDPDLYDT